MKVMTSTWILLLVFSMSTAAAAAEPNPRALVLDFTVGQGLDSELGETLQNMFVSHLTKLNRFELVQRFDIAALIGVEAEKQMLGCDENACLAELGGALGAKRIIAGTVALLGGKQVLTVKIVDSEEVKLLKQLARQLPADMGEYSEALRVLSYELFDLEAPPLIEPWHERTWVRIVAGGVLAGIAAGSYVAAQPSEVPQGNLGRVEF